MNDNNRIEVSVQEENVLFDKSKNGKERPWKDKKLGNAAYYEILAFLGFKKADRVSACAEVLRFKVFENGEKRLNQAWFCKSPLCPVCNWRKAMKHSYQVMMVVSEVSRRRKTARWLFLTLTVRNAYDGDELDKSLRDITEGFRRLMMYKRVAKNLIGFVRSTEITVNPENGTYNQHIHVLLCVKSTYFKDKENYIEQSEWTDLWQRAMKLDYTPIVHIEAVKEKKKVKQTDIESKLPAGLESAVKETAKYAVKSADYLTDDDELGKYWAELADLYVSDAFGSVHRAHASTVGIPTHLPSACGYLIEKELKFLGDAVDVKVLSVDIKKKRIALTMKGIN